MSTRLRWVWRGTTSPATDFMDPRTAASKLRLHGGAASPDGIVAARLQATSRGASIAVEGKGATLPLASLGLTLPIWAQLSVSSDRAEDGTCWQGVFLSALRNDPQRFEARGAVIPR